MNEKTIQSERLYVSLNLNQSWFINLFNPSVMSPALYSLLLSINTFGNLLMCDSFLQIIFLSTFHISTFLIYVYLLNQKSTDVYIFNINVNVFLYFLYINSILDDLNFLKCYIK